MRVVAVPCLSDNYAYLVIDETAGEAAVVDPGEAAPVEAALAREKVRLVAIWATHHHVDHVGGAGALLDAHGGVELVAHRVDAPRIPRVTRLLEDGDEVAVGSLRATIIHNPGHTLGAISYFLGGEFGRKAGAVFTGDTLFGAGCGRLFEGTAAMMHASLARLAALPGDTRVYFGHEYTVANLRFAAAVEPRSHAIADRAAAIEKARGRGVPSVPSTISDERSTNPFLRVAEAAVMAAVATRAKGSASGEPVAVFAALREWKNEFR